MGVLQSYFDSLSKKNLAQAALYNAQLQFANEYAFWAYMIYEALHDAHLQSIVCPPLEVVDVCCYEASNSKNFAFRINFVKSVDDGIRRYIKSAIVSVLLRGLGLSAADLKQHFRIKIVSDFILISRKN